jgi:HlyD family secretion protein
VEVEMTRPEDIAGLLPGYSADIEILVREVEDTLRVPTEAVFDGDRVLIFNPATRRLEKKSFDPGVSNWEYTEVRKGLSVGEQVVISVGRKGVEAGVLASPVSPDDDTSDDES